MANLYDISTRFNNIMELVNGEFEMDELRGALEEITEEFETKADNICYIMRDLEGTIETIKREEDRLAKRRKTLENNCKNLKSYLYDAMIYTNRKKFKTDFNSFTIAKNKPSLEITDDSYIPSEFIKEEVVTKIDKNELLKAVKDGLDVMGVAIKESESLRIR